MKYLNALFGIIAILICANVSAAPLDVSGTYTAEISYSKQTPKPDRKWFFGANPDIEFILTQKGDKISGEFSGDRDGEIKGLTHNARLAAAEEKLNLLSVFIRPVQDDPILDNEKDFHSSYNRDNFQSRRVA